MWIVVDVPAFKAWQGKDAQAPFSGTGDQELLLVSPASFRAIIHIISSSGHAIHKLPSVILNTMESFPPFTDCKGKQQIPKWKSIRFQY